MMPKTLMLATAAAGLALLIASPAHATYQGIGGGSKSGSTGGYGSEKSQDASANARDGCQCGLYWGPMRNTPGSSQPGNPSRDSNGMTSSGGNGRPSGSGLGGGGN